MAHRRQVAGGVKKTRVSKAGTKRSLAIALKPVAGGFLASFRIRQVTTDEAGRQHESIDKSKHEASSPSTAIEAINLTLAKFAETLTKSAATDAPLFQQERPVDPAAAAIAEKDLDRRGIKVQTEKRGHKKKGKRS